MLFRLDKRPTSTVILPCKCTMKKVWTNGAGRVVEPELCNIHVKYSSAAQSAIYSIMEAICDELYQQSL
jgi:hypothetical protein